MTQYLTTVIADSLKANWHSPILSDFQGASLTCSDVAGRIEKIHIILKETGINPGDKIALCARNSSSWATAFLGALTYGAVVVPLLHEFHPENVEYLVSHSEARLLFTEKNIFDQLDETRLGDVLGAVLVSEMTVAFSRSKALTTAIEQTDALFAKKYPDGFTQKDVDYPQMPLDRLALINYTSGSTGNSKGVMLSYGNLWSNVSFGLKKIDFLHKGGRDAQHAPACPYVRPCV